MPYRLLLADDSLTIQKVVELTFPDPEYELLAVGNGDKAMEALDSFRPDVVLADVVMPGPTGYDVCEAVRRRPQGATTPVILLTGTFEPFDRARADRAGATAVVTKPFDSHALSSMVRDLLLKAAQERAAAESGAPAADPTAGEETLSLGDVPAPRWGAKESAASDLFGSEPAPSEEPEELYATSAIPISSIASAFVRTPAAEEAAAEPLAEAAEPEEPVQEAEPAAAEPEGIAFTPAPADEAPAPRPAPTVSPSESLAFEPAEDEPLPPPPPFETARVAPVEGWTPAAESVEESAREPWEPEPAAEVAEAAALAPPPPDERTQPLPAGPTPLAFEDELPPPPPFDASDEYPERTEAIDVHSAATPTAIIDAREPEPLTEPPLAMEEPPPPISEPEAVAEPAREAEGEAAADEEELPPAAEEELPVVETVRAIPDEPGLPPSDVFEVEAPAPEPSPAEPVAVGSAPVPVAAPEPEAGEAPRMAIEEEPEELEPPPRDIDEDIAAYESGAHPIVPSEPAELEALAAGASLTDLIPQAAASGAAPGRPLSDEEVERIARRVAELVGEKVLRDVAWEVVPELAERLVRARLAEIERE